MVIPDKLVTKLSPPNFKTWTSLLASRIATTPTSFLTDPHQWVKCVNPLTTKDCAITWAQESNNYTCSYVYLDYENVDLGDEYFVGAVPIVETQVAKGNFPSVLAEG